jgi:hypothetical protein
MRAPKVNVFDVEMIPWYDHYLSTPDLSVICAVPSLLVWVSLLFYSRAAPRQTTFI